MNRFVGNSIRIISYGPRFPPIYHDLRFQGCPLQPWELNLECDYLARTETFDDVGLFGPQWQRYYGRTLSDIMDIFEYDIDNIKELDLYRADEFRPLAGYCKEEPDDDIEWIWL